MSKINQTLVLAEPTCANDLDKFLKSGIVHCFKCFGKGVVRVYVHDHEEEASEIDNTCPICKGTGKIQADVNIKWRSVK